MSHTIILNDEIYNRLKEAKTQTRRTMKSMLYEAIDSWLRKDRSMLLQIKANELLERIRSLRDDGEE